MFGQTYDNSDIAVIGLLIVIECALSIDNALVLGLLAKRLHKDCRAKALSYGLVGAIAFRLLAILAATVLLRWRFIKIVGGVYLLVLGLKHLRVELLSSSGRREVLSSDVTPDAAVIDPFAASPAGFWATVGLIELADIAFSIDSIVAAIALVGPAPAHSAIHPKLWIVFTAGVIFASLMRFVASLVTLVLDRFPRLETVAYLLVMLIGAKLLVENGADHGWGWNPFDWQHIHELGFWIFWAVSMCCVLGGIWPERASRLLWRVLRQRPSQAFAGRRQKGLS